MEYPLGDGAPGLAHPMAMRAEGFVRTGRYSRRTDIEDQPENLRTNVASALGLFAALCFLPIPAIVLGVIGTTQSTRRAGIESGRVMGAWAQLIGFVELFVWATILIARL